METQELKHLGQQSQEPVEELDLIPWKGGEVEVVLDCTEFTSRCPVTKQPDFGELEIRYWPRNNLVETKSLKLFLWHFRDQAMFNEVLVNHISMKFWRQVQPARLVVTGRFHARGGIKVTAISERTS